MKAFNIGIFLSALFLFPLSGIASCNQLDIVLNNQQTQPVKNLIIGLGTWHFNHGRKQWDSQSAVAPGNSFLILRGVETNKYGPDIDLTILGLDVTTMTYTTVLDLNVQQNYCFLEAGDISYKVRSSVLPVNFTVTEGSANYHRGGVFTINFTDSPPKSSSK